MTSSSQTDLVHVAREGVDVGAWSELDVIGRLKRGELFGTDHYWREGMAEWNTLDHFQSVSFSPRSFLIIFGSGRAIDKFGFVRTGQIVFTDKVQLSGQRHWSVLARIAVFLVATPICMIVFSAIRNFLPEEGDFLLYFVKAVLGILVLIGSPLLALTLIHYFCVRPDNVTLERSTISEVGREGKQVSFMGGVSRGKRRRCLFKTMSEAEAGEIVRRLN